jgi:hypothetical protein
MKTRLNRGEDKGPLKERPKTLTKAQTDANVRFAHGPGLGTDSHIINFNTLPSPDCLKIKYWAFKYYGKSGSSKKDGAA